MRCCWRRASIFSGFPPFSNASILSRLINTSVQSAGQRCIQNKNCGRSYILNIERLTLREPNSGPSADQQQDSYERHSSSPPTALYSTIHVNTYRPTYCIDIHDYIYYLRYSCVHSTHSSNVLPFIGNINFYVGILTTCPSTTLAAVIAGYGNVMFLLKEIMYPH